MYIHREREIGCYIYIYIYMYMYSSKGEICLLGGARPVWTCFARGSGGFSTAI